MRKASERLIDFYKTSLGQDVIETLAGAGMAATGQALFTDMTPEQIAVATALGIGAASVGRPLVGTTGQYIGKRLSKNPGINSIASDMINVNYLPKGFIRDSMAAKLAPYAHLSAPEQVGQILGRGYGDNIMQGIVALAAPTLMYQENTDA